MTTTPTTSTTTTSGATLRVHPVSPAELGRVRRRGRDLWGNVPEPFVSRGGDQIRCCLRHSRRGELLWVVAHAPLTVRRPWREVGPVFVHPEPCAGYDPSRGLPDFIGRRPRVLRSYTALGAMHYPGNRVTGPGDDLGGVLRELLDDPRVAEVHLRNVEAQCFIARVTR
ncbi:DUF1203 domain-containing protein [Auraticoccus sp. F435]|uniref:DUF1203 domain-containing protein n=1 Tax=Auraticoccus cholistanensis TaxID=2656650 RepID=A0A6A9UW76_9ACTN|nr:DUF1203 domain-containing protein [Auraticoccus cholistanensis]MVA75467.1 DUF1203 domain-containing protein [Auraticoccus cholistanensis]